MNFFGASVSPGRHSGVVIETADLEDAEEILALQKLAYLSEAEIYRDYNIPPLVQTLDEIRGDFEEHMYLKAVHDGMIIGSVRGTQIRGTCHIGRLVVHPEFQNQGIGSQLMGAIEGKFNAIERYELFTGERSDKNLHLYHKLGYRTIRSEGLSEKVTLVIMEKLSHGEN